ncbi:hypothetical protein [Streptomyces tibetensis]|uniref:hypothetical protein n=1 Tax=Streptomyces tibetensis TaxID=2382123 RepID=UPI003F4CB8DF
MQVEQAALAAGVRRGLRLVDRGPDAVHVQTFLKDAAAQWAQIDPGRYPFVHAAATRLGEHDDREQFLVGVDIFLAGIAALRQRISPVSQPCASGSQTARISPYVAAGALRASSALSVPTVSRVCAAT